MSPRLLQTIEYSHLMRLFPYYTLIASNMKFSVIAAASFAVVVQADYCRYRIRSYSNSACSGTAGNDAYLNSRDCFNTNHYEYIWIDSVNGTDYCTQGNWIREYANYLHMGSCSNNNRGQQNVAMQSCEKLQHYGNGAINTDSIRINYA